MEIRDGFLRRYESLVEDDVMPFIYSVFPHYPDLDLILAGPYLIGIDNNVPQRLINEIIQFMEDVEPHHELWSTDAFIVFWDYLNTLVNSLENMLLIENIEGARRFVLETPIPLSETTSIDYNNIY